MTSFNTDCAELLFAATDESDAGISQPFHPKPTNRELVSAALRLLARRDMSRSEFISKLTKQSLANLAKPSNASSFSRSSFSSSSSLSSLSPRSHSNDNGANRAVAKQSYGTNTRSIKSSAKSRNTDTNTTAKFSAPEIEAVAAWCAAEGFLNEVRFAEGKARSLAGRYGARRVGATLKQKGVTADIVAETVAALKETDLARAHAMWQRKFGEQAKSTNDRNKQVRYLQSRGFGFDVIKRVISGSSDIEAC